MDPNTGGTVAETAAPVAEAPQSGASSGVVATETPKESGRSWFDRLIGRNQTVSPKSADASADTSEASPAAPTEPPVAEKPVADAPKTRAYTEEEIARLVQSETDRRIAKQAQKTARQQERERLQADPFGASEERLKALDAEEAVEANQARFGEVAGNVTSAYDAAVLDPIFQSLPEDARARALGAMGEGINGRGAGVKAALDELKKAAFAEGERAAEKRLRGNPSFRKQLLLEARGNLPEPELAPVGQGPGASVDMNSLIRRVAGGG
jgi:hypothetical protein